MTRHRPSTSPSTRSSIAATFTLAPLLAALLAGGCGAGSVQAAPENDVVLFADTAGANGSLLQACTQLDESCRGARHGCLAAQRFCGSGTQEGICAALSSSCPSSPQACAVHDSYCSTTPAGASGPSETPAGKGGDGAAPQDPDQTDPDQTDPGQSSGKDSTPPGDNPPQAPSGDQGKGGGSGTGFDATACCPTLDPCIQSSGTNCAAMAQACGYPPSVDNATLAAKAAAIKQAYCSNP